MEKQEVVMEFERETKRTYRYNENADLDSKIIGVIYVDKKAFGDEAAPKKIKVTIEAEE